MIALSLVFAVCFSTLALACWEARDGDGWSFAVLAAVMWLVTAWQVVEDLSAAVAVAP